MLHPKDIVVSQRCQALTSKKSRKIRSACPGHINLSPSGQGRTAVVAAPSVGSLRGAIAGARVSQRAAQPLTDAAIHVNNYN
jgi:hypothetical protein